jgi:predicted nucleic acid-binding protein
MTRRVLDTSVAVAWYLPEEFSAVAKRWQIMMLDGKAELRVPSLHYWEFANVLRTYVKRGELDPDTAQEIWSLHLEAPLLSGEPDRASVLAIALRYESTVYDAVYLALSLELDEPLLTAERSTTPWVKKLGRLADCVRGSHL